MATAMQAAAQLNAAVVDGGEQPEADPRKAAGAWVATPACSAVPTQPMAAPAARNGATSQGASW